MLCLQTDLELNLNWLISSKGHKPSDSTDLLGCHMWETGPSIVLHKTPQEEEIEQKAASSKENGPCEKLHLGNDILPEEPKDVAGERLPCWNCCPRDLDQTDGNWDEETRWDQFVN